MKQKKVLITGASSGIGKAIAQSFLRQQVSVVGVSRDVTRFDVNDDHFHPVQIDF